MSLQPIALRAPGPCQVSDRPVRGQPDVLGELRATTARSRGRVRPGRARARTPASRSRTTPTAPRPGQPRDVEQGLRRHGPGRRAAAVRAGSPTRTVTPIRNTDLDLYLYHDANNDGTFSADELSTCRPARRRRGRDRNGRHRRATTASWSSASPRKSPSTYDFSTWLASDPAVTTRVAAPGSRSRAIRSRSTTGQPVKPGPAAGTTSTQHGPLPGSSSLQRRHGPARHLPGRADQDRRRDVHAGGGTVAAPCRPRSRSRSAGRRVRRVHAGRANTYDATARRRR